MTFKCTHCPNSTNSVSMGTTLEKGLSVSQGVSLNVQRSLLIDTKFSPFYNEEKKKEDNKMSFVGLHVNPNTKKVIAFADQKLSHDNGENIEQNKDRPWINKLFVTGSYIAVSYNVATFLEGMQTIYLDNYMEGNKDKDIEVVLRNIWEKLRNCREKNSMYFFYVKKGEYGYYHSVELNADKLVDSKIVTDIPCTVFGGEARYVEPATKDPRFNSDSKEKIREAIYTYILFYDEQPYYNSVGGDVKVVDWEW